LVTQVDCDTADGRTSLCMVLQIEGHAAIPCCAAYRRANFAPALIARSTNIKMAWRGPLPSSRLTERHLYLTGNGIRLRCKPVVAHASGNALAEAFDDVRSLKSAYSYPLTHGVRACF
jgi:hypothetical protein